MIETHNLCINFKKGLFSKEDKVLKDISFKVEEGDILGILGESGSGKTTLSKVLMGVLKPSKGEYIFFNNKPYQSREAKKFLSHNVSVVFQDYNNSVNPRFTVFEIISESIKLRLKREEKELNIKEEVINLLETVGLNESFIDRYPHQLSGGQLQRVCIARAIAVKPKVIIFDEALSSLDAHTQVQIMDLLKEIHQKMNYTYIFITHDLMSITYLCDKVMFLHKGEVTEFIEVNNLSKTEDEYAKKLFSTIIYI